jgi:hypothetical protein
MLGDGRRHHARSEEIPGSLRQDIALEHGTRVVAHATGEVTKAQAEPGAVKILGCGASQNTFQFPDSHKIPARVPIVLPLGAQD